MMNELINNNKNKILYLIFLLILIVGLSSVKDYGVSGDESDQRHSGFVELNYVGKKILPNLTDKLTHGKEYVDLHDKNYNEKYAGHLLNSVFGIIEIILKIDDRHEAFLLRHYLYFLIFFSSLIAFYNLCNLRFRNWKISLLSVFILLLSPRIFANSFYDPKDIPFLSLLIFSVYFGLRFFKNLNLKNAILFAIFNALVISGIRVYGLISPLLIYSSIIFYLTIKDELKFKSIILIINSIIFTIFFSILLKPYLWESPITNFYESIKYIGNFGNFWNVPNLFFGEIIYAKATPWFYNLVWIAITTPFFYTALFLVGIIIYFKNFLLSFKKNFYTQEFYFDSIFITLFFVPFIGSSILSESSFNGWRHLYFIYPYFVIFSILAYDKLTNLISHKKYTNLIHLSTLLILCYYAFWMLKNHPHQYAYFNIFGGKEISKNFDIDYHAQSYKENLNYILANDNRKKIYIINNSINKPILFLYSLKKDDREKFIHNFDDRYPDYILTNYFLDKIKRYKKYDDEFINKNYFIFKQLIVDDNIINTVFKKK